MRILACLHCMVPVAFRLVFATAVHANDSLTTLRATVSGWVKLGLHAIWGFLMLQWGLGGFEVNSLFGLYEYLYINTHLLLSIAISFC